MKGYPNLRLTYGELLEPKKLKSTFCAKNFIRKCCCPYISPVISVQFTVVEIAYASQIKIAKNEGKN